MSTNSGFLSCLFEEEDYSAALAIAFRVRREYWRADCFSGTAQTAAPTLTKKKVCVKWISKFRSSWLNLFRYCLNSRGIERIIQQLLNSSDSSTSSLLSQLPAFQAFNSPAAVYYCFEEKPFRCKDASTAPEHVCPALEPSLSLGTAPECL